MTAFHEMGHALVGHFLPNTDPVHKISIVSRGQALGYTISLPTEDKFLTTKAELNDTLGMALGGRTAEEIEFGEITTGAANDIERATNTAKQMVMRWGMSEKLGPRVLGHNQAQPFLGREFCQQARLLGGGGARDRQRDPAHHRRGAQAARATSSASTASSSTAWPRSSSTARRWSGKEFEALLDGVPEEEVFREKDEKARRKAEKESDREKRAPTPRQPQIGAPAPVNPLP